MLALHITKFACFRQTFFRTRNFGLRLLLVDDYSLLRHENRSSSGRKDNFPDSTEIPKKKVLVGNSRLKSALEKKGIIIEKENIWTIPNILCCARIAFSPYLGFLIYSGQFNLAFYVMILVGLTDVLDGAIARTFVSQSSKFGSFLDPLADKILITTTCVALTSVKLIPVALTALILSRDVTLIAAGFYIRYKSLPPPKTLVRYFDASYATARLEPTKISKFNSLVQLGTVGVGLLSPVVGFTGHPWLEFLWYFTASTTVASAVSYVFEIEKYKFNTEKIEKPNDKE